jgi:hypothetical protein
MYYTYHLPNVANMYSYTKIQSMMPMKMRARAMALLREEAAAYVQTASQVRTTLICITRSIYTLHIRAVYTLSNIHVYCSICLVCSNMLQVSCFAEPKFGDKATRIL